jgi:Right handed beta helix region
MARENRELHMPPLSIARRLVSFLAFASLLLVAPFARAVGAPTVAVFYSPNSMAQGATSTLGIQILDQSGLGFTGGHTTAPFVYDTTGSVVNAATPIQFNSCSGAGFTLTATPGGTSLQLSGVDMLTPGGSCFIDINVTTTGPGTYSTTFPAGGFTASTGSNFSSGPVTLTSVAPIVVTSTADSGAGSLRNAITQINGGVCSAGAAITFAIPGAGVQTITPLSQLPALTCGPVMIDGYSQTGAVANSSASGSNNATINIGLDGSNCSGCDGLQVTAGGQTIRGLAIYSFAGAGVSIGGAGSVSLFGNYIGTDPGGMNALGNAATGVKITGGQLMLGSSSPGDANLVSANGVGVWVASTSRATISNNLIGGKRDGTSGNGNAGLGIYFNGACCGSISANFVRYNGAAGIAVDAATTGRVITSVNSSFANGGIGIDFNYPDGATPNNTAGVENYPVITSVTHVGSDTVVSGSLQRAASSSPLPATIELYHNTTLSPLTEGEGVIDVFSTSLDITGFVAFTRTIVGSLVDNVSATTTVDTCGDGCLQSSEYSPMVAVVVPASVGFTPASLTFAARTVSTTSPAQTLTLTNSGAGALAISSITITGDFAFTSACGASLAAGATCALNVTFTPLATGLRTGAIAIASNATGSPQSVALSGSGQVALAPIIRVTPSVGEFAPQELGTTSSAQLFVIINVGNATLVFNDISVTGAGFTLQPTVTSYERCGAAIQSGAVCAVQVTFAPPATGPFAGVLRVTGNASNSPLDVPLVASGVITVPPRALSMQSSLAFPDQPVGTQSAGLPVTITNTSASTVSITELSVTGDFDVSDTCTTIAAHTTCAPLVTFGPTALDARNGTLTIHALSESAPYLVGLSGNGVFSDVPQVSLSVTHLGFGDTLIDAPVTAHVTLTNVGTVPVNLQSVLARGPFLVSETCPFSIPVHGTCDISISFFPNIVGAVVGTIEIATNAAGSPHEVQVSGVGCAIPSVARFRAGTPLCGS